MVLIWDIYYEEYIIDYLYQLIGVYYVLQIFYCENCMGFLWGIYFLYFNYFSFCFLKIFYDSSFMGNLWDIFMFIMVMGKYMFIY